MTDTEYMDRAEALLRAVEQACDRINDESDADIDTQITINLQKPLQEVWMAAKAGGFHYRFDGQVWRDTKAATEFFADLSRFATEQSGQTTLFPA